MSFLNRNAALALGLAIPGGLSFGTSDARAQYLVPSAPVPTYYASPSRAYVPVVPRYAAPAYYHQNGFYHPVRDGRGAAFTPHYGYEPARRDLKLYKPWLSRD